jgi:uncharacterized protein (TIGR02145 family)
MKHREFAKILAFGVLCGFIFSCSPIEIVLHGDLTGIVTDFESNQPINSAAIKLNQLSLIIDTTRTDVDGKYIFNSIKPGYYEISVSKQAYKKESRDVKVESATTDIADFAIVPIPIPEISPKYVDFGFEPTEQSFTISNAGKGKLKYSLSAQEDWITLDQQGGEATTEKDTIRVTIDRNVLPDKKQKGIIRIISYIGDDIQQDTVYVLVNGVIDQDGNYYNIVTIGTQTWMAENLNTGVMLNYGLGIEPENNEIVEKHCYENVKSNCDIYGGLYHWGEMMNYTPSTETMRMVQGICPVGWHIPTGDDWNTLFKYLGGSLVAGGKLKEEGTGHWTAPNTATNESGFTALPGGYLYVDSENPPMLEFGGKGVTALFWQAYNGGVYTQNHSLDGTNTVWDDDALVDYFRVSVRCVKDP